MNAPAAGCCKSGGPKRKMPARWTSSRRETAATAKGNSELPARFVNFPARKCVKNGWMEERHEAGSLSMTGYFDKGKRRAGGKPWAR